MDCFWRSARSDALAVHSVRSGLAPRIRRLCAAAKRHSQPDARQLLGDAGLTTGRRWRPQDPVLAGAEHAQRASGHRREGQRRRPSGAGAARLAGKRWPAARERASAEIPTVANGGIAKDFTSVTWKLRQGLKWSDGAAFSADDVAFTYEYQCDPATADSTIDRCDEVQSVVARDPNTVVGTYRSPHPYVFQRCVGAEGAILQKDQYKSCLGPNAASCPADINPVGTGPYKVRDFKVSDVATFDLNENFRDQNKPFFKSVTFKGGTDPEAAARAVFQSGEVDYAWNLQVESNTLRTIAQNSQSGTLDTVFGASVERLHLNFSNPDAALGDKRAEPDTKHPFLADKSVRRALAMATNRDAIAQQLYGDGVFGKATCNLIATPETLSP